MPHSRRRPLLVGELAVVLLLVKVYDWIRHVQGEQAGPALAHARDLLAAERFLHLHPELAANRWLAAHPLVSGLAGWWYQLAHVGVTLGALCWCYVSRPDIYRRLRTALMLTNVVAVSVYVLFPVMPPRLLPGETYTDTVATIGFGGDGVGTVAGQYGALPSLHVAWATWAAAVLFVLLPRCRWLAVIYPAITAAVVILTGNHYALDVLAGMAVTALTLLASHPRIRAVAPQPRATTMPAAKLPRPPTDPERVIQ